MTNESRMSRSRSCSQPSPVVCAWFCHRAAQRVRTYVAVLRSTLCRHVRLGRNWEASSGSLVLFAVCPRWKNSPLSPGSRHPPRIAVRASKSIASDSPIRVGRGFGAFENLALSSADLHTVVDGDQEPCAGCHEISAALTWHRPMSNREMKHVPESWHPKLGTRQNSVLGRACVPRAVRDARARVYVFACVCVCVTITSDFNVKKLCL